MRLLYGIWALISSAELAMQASLDERQQEFVCIDESCYSISWANRRYARARQDCDEKQQRLITVKSSTQANAISRLLFKVKEDNVKVWIGMEPKKGCTDLHLPLRGFTWVTGDTFPVFSAWNNAEQMCIESGDLCVTINNNGTLEETGCSLKSDGLLCESGHFASCKPLMLSSDYRAIYFHPSLGMALHLSNFYPLDTIVNISPTNEILTCEDNGIGSMKWNKNIPGAWTCDIENGGCDHECVMVNGNPECVCPLGLTLYKDKRSCSSPCEPNLCSQDCDPSSLPPNSPCRCIEGYYLAPDGKTCLQDNCIDNPKSCAYHCTNNSGKVTCDCNPGFESVNFDCDIPGECGVKCQDSDECETVICEHTCKNVHGSFMCVCYDGFISDENNSKKCKRVCNTSVCEADCEVKRNKTSCNCPEGYILEERICVDVDECLESPCKWSCVNLFGSYQCTCPDDYTSHNNDCIPQATEEPKGIPTETTSSDSSPQNTFSMEPTVLLGICVAILSMVIVLTVMVCHMLRKRYMDQHDFNHKIKSTEKYVVLQQAAAAATAGNNCPRPAKGTHRSSRHGPNRSSITPNVVSPGRLCYMVVNDSCVERPCKFSLN